jgi:membrane protein implicated in regulation of membrane protease activity
MKYNKHLYILGIICCFILLITPTTVMFLYHDPIMNYFHTQILHWVAVIIFVGPIVLALWLSEKLKNYRLKSNS